MINATVDRALAILREVPGVDGSFVVDEIGGLVARDPAMGLPEWLLAGAATRLSTLLESSEDAFQAPREMTLVFADRLIMVRVSAPYLLALLVRPGTSMEAVRLASNVALRQVARALLSPQPPASSAFVVSKPPALSAPPSLPVSAPVVSQTLKSPASVSPRSAAPKSGTKPAATAPAAAPKKKKSDIWG